LLRAMSEPKAAQSLVMDALTAEGGAASALGTAFRRIRHVIEGRELSGRIDRHEQDILDVARASLTLLDEIEEGRSGSWAARHLRDLLERQLVAGCRGDIGAPRIRGKGVRSALLGGSLLFAMVLAVVLTLGARDGEADKGELHEPPHMQLPTAMEEPRR